MLSLVTAASAIISRLLIRFSIFSLLLRCYVDIFAIMLLLMLFSDAASFMPYCRLLYADKMILLLRHAAAFFFMSLSILIRYAAIFDSDMPISR